MTIVTLQRANPLQIVKHACGYGGIAKIWDFSEDRYVHRVGYGLELTALWHYYIYTVLTNNWSRGMSFPLTPKVTGGKSGKSF